MKKTIFLSIFIAILAVFSFKTVSAVRVNMVMVPEYIQGYRTVDLLDFLATLKKQDEDKKQKEAEQYRQEQIRIQQEQVQKQKIEEYYKNNPEKRPATGGCGSGRFASCVSA